MSAKPCPLSPSTRNSGASSGAGVCFGGNVASSVRPMIIARRSASEMSLDRGGPAQRAVAQHRDAIGDLAYLGEPVRDVDDGRAVGGELADGGEEELDGILRERRRRLVEDQQPGRHGERLGESRAGDAERR